MNPETSRIPIEIDSNHLHSYSKNVSMIVFPVKIAKIKRAIMYVEVNGYKHPVVVNNNHFALPVEFHSILDDHSQKLKLLHIAPEQGYLYFVGQFVIDTTKKRIRYYLTIDKKIREILDLKEKDVVEVRVEGSTFYIKVWWQANGKSMLAFFPGRILEMLHLIPNIPYQFKIKKSEKPSASNEHFYSTYKSNLEFDEFLTNGSFNLYEFLKMSYAKTKGGKLRKFKINKINDKQLTVYYLSGGPISKNIKIKPTFIVNSDFFRMMGLLQAECSKSIKKTFCFTNENPENIKYVIKWFEKHMNFSRKSWLYELSIDPRIKKSKNKIKSKWADLLEIDSNLIKVYPKKFGKITNKTGIMNLRSYGRTLKEIIMRLLECTKKYVSENEEPAGYFLSGVLAGDGYTANTKGGSLNYVSICFDPNKDELDLYVPCLKTLGIPDEDIKIYINEHEKAENFIMAARKYGIKIKVHKKGSIGFGGEINIFKFRSFKKLARFTPFFPNKLNAEKFTLAFSKIDRNRVRFL